MTNRSWAWIHLALTVSLVVWNGVANAGILFADTVGQVSARTENTFTPAGYAFSIWGPIYLGLLTMSVVEVMESSKGREARFVRQLGTPFAVAQVVCALWLVAWLSGAIALSLLAMTLLLACLFLCVVRLRGDAGAPSARARWLVALPMELYFGWIVVAWLANLSALVVTWGGTLAQTSTWALGLLVVLTLIQLGLLAWRGLWVSNLVAVWAAVAVAVNQRNAPAGDVVANATAVCVSLLLLAVVTWGLAQRRAARAPQRV